MEDTKPAKFITPFELVERWRFRVSTGTLANWRSLKYGPSYIKTSETKSGRVLYILESVEAWEKDRLHGFAVQKEEKKP